MQLSKRALLSAIVATAYSFCPLFAEDLADPNSEENLDDFKAIRKYIEDKRNISISDKGGSLKIGGDVRVSYRHTHQLADGQQVEGSGFGGNRQIKDWAIPQNTADIEANVSLEYTHDTSYSNILLRFKNNMGIDATNFNDLDRPNLNENTNLSYKSYQPGDSKISLARAFIGDELWSSDSHKVVGEIGRQRLYDIFDSRIMFFNRFDGVALKYTGDFEGVGKAHATYGGFLVADRANHYAHAVELGLAQVLDSNFSVKYSLINWKKNHTYSDGSDASQPDTAPCNVSPLFGGTNSSYAGYNRLLRFTVSQASVAYTVPSDFVGGQTVKLYAAWAHNHAAKGMKDYSSDDLNNNAWYAGFTLGRIQMPSDWVLDFNYQYVGAQSVPEFDTLGGAGRGNLRNVWLFMDPTQGFTNYQGIAARFVYCISADMLVNLKAAMTKAANSKLSAAYTEGRTSRNRYNGIEAELVYSY
jgi:hypothetical protein